MRPLSAFVLGWAGVIPFAALAIATVARWPLPVPAEFALRAYGVAILSFMGGVQWGLTMRAGDGSDEGWRGYAASVLPALLGWVALLIPSRPGLVLLAIGFAALLAYDLRTVRQGYAPPWYGRLRWQLTSAVVVLLGVAAAFG